MLNFHYLNFFAKKIQISLNIRIFQNVEADAINSSPQSSKLVYFNHHLEATVTWNETKGPDQFIYYIGGLKHKPEDNFAALILLFCFVFFFF